LRVLVCDENGQPVAGFAVKFTPSPDGVVSPASTVTDSEGLSSGYVAISIRRGCRFGGCGSSEFSGYFKRADYLNVTSDFPKLFQVREKGSLIAAARRSFASIRSGDASHSERERGFGVAEQYLHTFCQFDYKAQQVCDGFVSPPGSSEEIVNLWQLNRFVGGNLDVSIEKSDLLVVRDIAEQEFPVLLAVLCRSNDPSPVLARSSMADYSSGFSAGGGSLEGPCSVQLILAPPARPPFWSQPYITPSQ
jgi:hypothetical protein